MSIRHRSRISIRAIRRSKGQRADLPEIADTGLDEIAKIGRMQLRSRARIGQRGERRMKCYYKWKLKKIQKEINQLQKLSNHRLVEDYTPNSRLRILDRLEKHLRDQLGKSAPPSTQN